MADRGIRAVGDGDRGGTALRSARRGLLYILLVGVALFMIGPFLWMLVTSMSSPGELYSYPPTLPAHPSVGSYGEVFRRFPFGRFTVNSLEIAILSTIGTLASASLAAYAFARMEFRGKSVLYWIVLATMMVPFQVTMVPVFFLIKKLGWIDSHAALIVPSFFGFGIGAFGVFLLRQFFASIPRELEEAAIIDGAGRFRIYWRIVMPLAAPALGTLAVLAFMANWNDLLGPVIYLSSQEKMTLTVGLASLQGGEMVSRIDLMMAGAVVSVIPILVLYMLAQRYFVKGIVMGGVKE